MRESHSCEKDVTLLVKREPLPLNSGYTKNRNQDLCLASVMGITFLS